MLKKIGYHFLSLFLVSALLFSTVSAVLTSAEEVFKPENLLQTELKSIKGVIKHHTSGNVSDHNQFNGSGKPFNIMFDGNIDEHADVYGANDWNHFSGALMELNDTFYCGYLKLFSGYSAYVDTYDVYASDKTEDLYSSVNRVGKDIVCDGSGTSVLINKNVKYVAIFLCDYDGNGRIAEVELWTAQNESADFQSENLLMNSNTEASGLLYNISTGVVQGNTHFNKNGAIAGATDGKTDTHYDVYGWSQDEKVGVMFTLDELYYVGDAVIASGLTGYPDYWTVYASDSLDTLYDNESLRASNLKCENELINIEIKDHIKYISFIFMSDGGRVRELELWTAYNDDKPFVSENAFATDLLDSKKGVLMNVATGIVADSQRFNDAALAATVDGDLTNHFDVYGALDWEDNKSYVGAVYALAVPTYSSHIMIYSGFDAYNDTYRVYASCSLLDLYDSKSIVADNIVCGDEGVRIELKKEVKYVAFFCTDYNGNQRVKEFELWTAEKQEGDTPKAPGGDEDIITKRVLTIGNSFAENAYTFATEIAAAQGYGLTFGYLKYPSCTIAQHYDNAINNKAAYKFAYSYYNDSSVSKSVVKDGEKECASIKEALDFMNWDIVVIQQGSMASYNFSSYEKTDELIAYIKNILPQAKIMIHETWSWSTWATDNNPANNFKNIEDCYHQIAAENGNLEIIPSGRAFEFARRDGLNVNDNDAQHANAFGQYLAGACYVARIFGVNIYNNSFGDEHPYFKDADMTKLRSAAMNAIYFNYDPSTNWDWEEKEDKPESKNFIKRHIEASSGLIQSLKFGNIVENDRISAANPSALELAIDGDINQGFEIWGALDWKDNPHNVGAMYTLDALYKVEKAVVYAGTKEQKIKVDIYASTGQGNLFNKRIAEGIVCDGNKVEVPINNNIKCVAFIVTDYIMDTSINFIEFDLVGSDKSIAAEKIVWPTAPKGNNFLTSAESVKIIAPGGDYAGTKEFEYRLMDQNDEVTLSKLTDGDYEHHFDVWSLAPNDKPGVLYILDSYYDITHLHAFAGAFGSELIVNNGFKIYASENLSDLYKSQNLVFTYHNENDSTNEAAVNVNLKRIRYIAFLLTDSSDGAWRMREFEAYGKKSADQTVAVEPTSIIEGIDAEYYGVATDNLADPVYMGASNYVFALTDGSRDPIEFWGGADINKSKFVFIYNLYANYDLTGVDIYAAADAIEEDSGIHKGIKSAKIYASRRFDDLFESAPLILKEDYADPKAVDENAYYTADADNSWKGVRYIAYVFTIGDSRYGACRLEELKAFGSLSAVQDEEEEEEKLPQYIDVKDGNGFVARIFAINAADDLNKLGAKLRVDTDNSAETLDFVKRALLSYDPICVYKIHILNESGADIDLGGRLVRLSIPCEESDAVLACVDEFGAEIVSTGILNSCLTVETETIRSYALVNKVADASSPFGGDQTLMWVLAAVFGVLSLAAIAGSVIVGIKTFKK